MRKSLDWNERVQISHFIAIKQDITKRKRAEEALQKLNAELDERVRERTARPAKSSTLCPDARCMAGLKKAIKKLRA